MKIRGVIYFALFVLLVLGGIALKRIWELPQYMMLCHLPAAVFLILAGIELKQNRQHDYDAEIAAIRGTASPEDWKNEPAD
jgi:hypothetical protein